MRKLLLLVLLFTIGVSLPAQKTIFKLWELPQRGCSLAEPGAFAQSDEEESFAMEDTDVFEAPVVAPAGFASWAAVVDTLRHYVAAQYQRDPEYLVPQINWRDELTFFRENGKWGLRRGEDEVLITPRFHHVLPDKNQASFVAHYQGFYNVFDTAGKAQFSTSYLHVKPLRQGGFIVRTKAGYGLIDAEGRELIPATMERVLEMSEGKVPYLLVSEDGANNYLYHLETGKYTYYNAPRYQWRLLDDRYALVNDAALIDLADNRLVFCGEGLKIKSVNIKEKTLLIARQEAPEEYYLVDFSGRLLLKQPLADAGPDLGDGLRVAAVPGPYEPGRRSVLNYGLLNEKGEWVIAPRFSSVNQQLTAGRFLIVRQNYQSSSLINLRGDTLLPFRPYRDFALTKDGSALKAVYETEDKQKVASLIDLKTEGVTELDDPGIWSRRPHGTCQGDTLYLAYSWTGEVLVDAEDNVLISEAGRIFTGPTPGTYYTLKSISGGKQRARQWIDCRGRAHQFNIQGKAVDTFHEFAILGEDFYYVGLTTEGGYLLFPDGREVATSQNWQGNNGRLGTGEYLLRGSGYRIGLVRDDGTTIIPPILEALFIDRKEGLIAYQTDDKSRQFLHPDGSRLFNGAYDSVQATGFGLFRVQRNGRWGLVDLAGRELIPPVHNYLYLRDGVITASRTSYRNEEYFDLLGRALMLEK